MLAQFPRRQGLHYVMSALAHARTGLLAQVRAAAHAPDGRFASAFAHLVAATEAAFRHEENLLEAVGFPGVREQRRDNALLLHALHHAAPLVEAGDLAIGREVLAALPCLLSLHRFCALRMIGMARAAPRSLGRTHPPARPRAREGTGLASNRKEKR